MSVLGKIAWTDTTGSRSFTFAAPARQIPFARMQAVRHDNIASSGVKEAVLERVDNFTDLNMDFVIRGADVSNWQSFMNYALQGGAFQYYPDSDSASFTTYTLEDTEWNAAYKAPGLYAFNVKFRQVVA